MWNVLHFMRVFRGNIPLTSCLRYQKQEIKREIEESTGTDKGWYALKQIKFQVRPQHYWLWEMCFILSPRPLGL